MGNNPQFLYVSSVDHTTNACYQITHFSKIDNLRTFFVSIIAQLVCENFWKIIFNDEGVD